MRFRRLSVIISCIVKKLIAYLMRIGMVLAHLHNLNSYCRVEILHKTSDVLADSLECVPVYDARRQSNVIEKM